MGLFMPASYVLKKKEKKKKKRGVNITQANSLKIQISSLWACAGFFSLILARFSLLKHPSATPEEVLTHHTKSDLLQIFPCELVERLW